MIVFAALLLAAVTFAFVAYPLLKQRLPSKGLVEDDNLQELRSKRATTYSMLKELEFDFESGVLTEGDYRDLEARYKTKAISILKDMDKLGKYAPVEDEIERQVLELRHLEAQFCPQCGARRRKSDHFCTHCGTQLDREGNFD